MTGRHLRQFARPACRWSGWRIAIGRCTRGVAAVEFALVAPVFLLLLMGAFDMAQMVYGKSVLHGAVQHAARTSTLEGADTSEADAKVAEMIVPILPGARVDSTRTSYFDFADIGRPEAWNDANRNGTCDNGETFTDENRNGIWDVDVGEAGNGGANDVVLYEVVVTYNPVFPIPFSTLDEGERKLKATAVKKNQPFAHQEAYGSEAGVCE